MLFQAEQSLRELNKTCLEMAVNASKETQHQDKLKELQLELKLEREQNQALKTDIQSLHTKLAQSTADKVAIQTKLGRAESEKETYITQLIKVKTEQAHLLDEANRIHQDSTKMK